MSSIMLLESLEKVIEYAKSYLDIVPGTSDDNPDVQIVISLARDIKDAAERLSPNLEIEMSTGGIQELNRDN